MLTNRYLRRTSVRESSYFVDNEDDPDNILTSNSSRAIQIVTPLYGAEKSNVISALLQLDLVPAKNPTSALIQQDLVLVKIPPPYLLQLDPVLAKNRTSDLFQQFMILARNLIPVLL
ncbi:hypothetical protein PoB_001137900 [Plakobranchus ocellatus]|uniref:Uncharacterized protein n=1 Tax=Plakobranchus ocellatus TaxID=259542 RepID=A0AAV3YS57_9GAST|nr:hypothetical protein PoB_001137900 [Plakobranchus ocellatus]